MLMLHVFPTYSNLVCTQFKIIQFHQGIQVLDLWYTIAHKEKVGQVGKLINVLDVLDLVEGKIQIPYHPSC